MPLPVRVVAWGGMVAVWIAAGRVPVAAAEFVLARQGQPAATIVVAATPSPAAAFAAQELQDHVEKISGAVLPIRLESEAVRGPRILVGPSAAAHALGVAMESLRDQEYVIHFAEDALVLLGRDAEGSVALPENWRLATGPRLPPPAMFEAQATSYAVHDFLERFGDVRWFGPGELEMVVPRRPTLAVASENIRRAPGFGYRHPWGPQTIITEQWNHASESEIALFYARLRAGGEKYQVNHSFDGYYDRFWKKNPARPELFEAFHPDWFAQDPQRAETDRPGQLCYSNEQLIAQVVADARRYFDGQPLKAGAWGAGDYFGIVPMDNGCWCKCPACRAQMAPERAQHEYSNGVASDYYFTFVNRVAQEVAKTHPQKHLATLAYYQFAYRPERVQLEPNVSVQLCLHIRNYWAPSMRENDARFYRDWIDHEPGRRFYVWLYYHFPEGDEAYHCFPGFSAHYLDRQYKMYARDGIRGAFLNNLGEQVDLYATLKLWDDPSLDIDALLDDFFARYYGPAGDALKRMYLRIEEIFANPENYPELIRTSLDRQSHQDETLAWKYLGTEERMAELAALMAEAERAEGSPAEKQRVALFRKAIWENMVAGRQAYLAKQANKE